MSEIRVARVYLQNLAARMDATASTLKSSTALGAYGVACTPEVHAVYQDFGNRWDERRDELASALECLADGFRSALSSFEQTDAEMAAQLTSDGGQ